VVGGHLKHLGYAMGSLVEAETQIILAKRLGYMNDEAAKALLGLAAEIGRMLNGLISSLERKQDAGP